jgi:hypothetical protein
MGSANPRFQTAAAAVEQKMKRSAASEGWRDTCDHHAPAARFRRGFAEGLKKPTRAGMLARKPSSSDPQPEPTYHLLSLRR